MECDLQDGCESSFCNLHKYPSRELLNLPRAESDKKDDLLFDFKHLCFKGHCRFVPVELCDNSDRSPSNVKDQVCRQIFQ